MIQFVARTHQPQYLFYVMPIIALLLSLVCGGFMFLALGYDVLATLKVFFVEPLQGTYNISEIVVKMIPLALIAMGLSVCFRANVWNIGAEGQYLCGALAGTAIALFLHEVDSWLILPTMVLAAITGGALWAAIPAFLKTRFNVNEILSSLMLNYVAFQLLFYLINGPMQDPEGMNFPETRFLSESALLPILFEGTRIHVGLLAVVIIALVLWFVFSKTSFGYKFDVYGKSVSAAQYASISEKKVIQISLLIAGSMAGVAGIFEVAGPVGQMTASFPGNYGYTGIIVAFLGRLHPIGVFFGAFIMSLLFIGTELAQIQLGIPLAVSGVFQGILLFFIISGDFFQKNTIRFKK